MTTKTSIDKDDPRFKFGPPLIQTAEDAYQAYITEAINREEYEEACGRFGGVPRPEPKRFGVLVQELSADEKKEATKSAKEGEEVAKAYEKNREDALEISADPSLRPEFLAEPKAVSNAGSATKSVEPDAEAKARQAQVDKLPKADPVRDVKLARESSPNFKENVRDNKPRAAKSSASHRSGASTATTSSTKPSASK
jgi:hypothetical protein